MTDRPHSYAIDLLEEVIEFLEPYVDVRDGSDGVPQPNAAMGLQVRVETEIYRLKRQSGPLVPAKPTDEMKEAGTQVRVNLRFGDTGISGFLNRYEAGEVYERMVEAASSATLGGSK